MLQVEHRLSSVRKDSQGEAGVIQDKTTTALAKQDAAEAQQVRSKGRDSTISQI